MSPPEDSEPESSTPSPAFYPSILPPVNPSGAPLEPAAAGAGRYEARRALGKGAMGEVRLCRDTRIGRDVAMKVIAVKYQTSAQARARFVREARVQGQLEHPAIVPVYDLGVDEGGAAFFTMKCLRGQTLAEILRALAAGDAEMARQFTRRRLLGAFSAACLAVDFAHSRGVLHRDLKPANVMLGDFGEVYVLDWGIAKISEAPASMRLPALNEAEEEEVHTAAGRILGTFGYMAPEQARGRGTEVDIRSDVYALGAILFEILALQPLHAKDVWRAMLMATVSGTDARPSARAPALDVPPELDAICVRATRNEPAERFASARALQEAVERFLEGDRDVEIRRQMASAHTRAAEAAAARASSGGAAAEEAMRTALHEVGRALALEPTNAAAMLVLREVLTTPPREIPAKVDVDVTAQMVARHAQQLREAVGADLSALILLAPICMWMGVRDARLLGVSAALTLVSTACKVLGARYRDVSRMYAFGYCAYLFNVLSVLCVSRGFGPLLFTPMLLSVFTFSYCMTYRGTFRPAVMVTGLAALCVSVGADMLGLTAPSYAFHDGAMIILPRAVTLPEVPTRVALFTASFFMILTPGILVARFQRTLQEAEQRSLLQAWHLGHLLPEEVRSPASRRAA
jgi:tRNA A-37 threonylcarbamoyl transferase component Bud32